MPPRSTCARTQRRVRSAAAAPRSLLMNLPPLPREERGYLVAFAILSVCHRPAPASATPSGSLSGLAIMGCWMDARAAHKSPTATRRVHERRLEVLEYGDALVYALVG